MKRDQRYYLLMLDYLLQELRNMEDNELSYVPKLAYLFHNIPTLLIYNFDEQKAEQAYQDILGRAEALGLKKWLNVCEQRVLSQMKDQS